MLTHRLRRWPSIEPTSDRRLVFAAVMADSCRVCLEFAVTHGLASELDSIVKAVVLYSGSKQTDRQTDILLTEKKVITDLFVIEMKEIYVHVYTRLLIF